MGNVRQERPQQEHFRYIKSFADFQESRSIGLPLELWFHTREQDHIAFPGWIDECIELVGRPVNRTHLASFRLYGGASIRKDIKFFGLYLGNTNRLPTIFEKFNRSGSSFCRVVPTGESGHNNRIPQLRLFEIMYESHVNCLSKHMNMC